MNIDNNNIIFLLNNSSFLYLEVKYRVLIKIYMLALILGLIIILVVVLRNLTSINLNLF